jgi:hypothetical protein
MATLTGNTIASTYTGLLSVTGAIGATTLESVTDGAGTATSLSLSQQKAKIVLGTDSGDDFTINNGSADIVLVEGDTNDVTLLDDLILISDSSVIKMGAGADATFTHDGTTGLTIAATPISINSTGDLTLDSSTDIVLDADGDNITMKAGSTGSGLDFIQSGTGDYTIKNLTSNKDIIFNINDGGSDTEVMRIDGDVSRVGIGVSAPAELLEVEDTSGNAFIQVSSGASSAAGIKYAANGAMKWQMYNAGAASHDMIIQDADGDNGSKMDQNDTDWESSSDERMKQDLVELSGSLDKLNTLRCVNYKMKHDVLKSLDKTRVGLIAQDVYKVYPEATSGDPNAVYSYNSDAEIPEMTNRHTNAMGLKYTNMIAPIIKAIQELSASNNALKARIEVLEAA